MKNLHKEMAVIQNHILGIKDEFLLVLMKLRFRLTSLDFAIRFRVSEATVFNIFITWLKFLYIRLSALKVWPHRRVILDNIPGKIQQEHLNKIIIIDCRELKIQCQSSLVLLHFEIPCIDRMGGFMLVPQLYTGSKSDKQIVTRTGFLELLSRKKRSVRS